jgi:hypothetical protein
VVPRLPPGNPLSYRLPPVLRSSRLSCSTYPRGSPKYVVSRSSDRQASYSFWFPGSRLGTHCLTGSRRFCGAVASLVARTLAGILSTRCREAQIVRPVSLVPRLPPGNPLSYRLPPVSLARASSCEAIPTSPLTGGGASKTLRSQAGAWDRGEDRVHPQQPAAARLC